MAAPTEQLDDRNGTVHWPGVLHASEVISSLTFVPADLLQTLKERVKSEQTHVVLNTLTALHTIALNGSTPVRDQLAASKVVKHLERLLNKPPFPLVEVAAAQLLLDWAFLFAKEELGHKSFHLLTNTSKHRAMLQAMTPSEVAVMLREDSRIGMPRFAKLVKGLDFGKLFATQLAGPLTGNAGAPSVLNNLARAAVAASYSDSTAAAAAAAAASRNTFAAWAERVVADPPAAAQRVLNAEPQVQADIQALAAAQAAVLAAARPFVGSNNGSSSMRDTSSAGRQQLAAQLEPLRRELDKAYLIACKCTEWREMIEVLVQQSLPGAQLSALLALADAVNATLEAWQAAATTELFWLLGVDTAGLADGSLLRQLVPGAAEAAAQAAAAAAAAEHEGKEGSKGRSSAQQAGLSNVNSGSYLDLLTGDTLLPSASANNPFLTPAAATAAAAPGQQQQQPQPQQQQHQQPPPQLQPQPPPQQYWAPSQQQAYVQELQQQHQLQQQWPPPQLLQQQQLQASGQAHVAAAAGASGHTPGGALLKAQSTGATDAARVAAAQTRLQQQQQQQPARAHSSAPSASSPTAATGGGAAAAAAAKPGIGASAFAAAAAAGGSGGDTGSSGDSAKAAHSYVNPFATLDTSTIISSLHISSPRTSSDGGSSRAAGAATARRGSTGTAAPAQSAGTQERQQQQQQHRLGAHARDQQWQQQQTALLQKRPPPPPPGQDAAAAAAGQTGLSAAAPSSPQQLPESSSHVALQPQPPAVVQQQQQQRQEFTAAVLEPQLLQLQQKLHEVLSSANGNSSGSSSRRCHACRLPPATTLHASLLQLLVEQHQAWEARLLAIQQQHQAEVTDIKETAVRRFKELMGQQQQQ